MNSQPSSLDSCVPTHASQAASGTQTTSDDAEKAQGNKEEEMARDASDTTKDDGEKEGDYAGVPQFLTVYLSVSLLAMLVWLDEGIVATAIPSISDRFNALSDIGWYGSAYLFALCSFQLPFGKVYKDFPLKPTFMLCMLLFEVGSIVQAAAPSSAAFITGRCIAGIGGAGVLTGALIIYSESMPKTWVPFAMGSIGWIYGVGVIAGPIMGGAITRSRLTWRW